MTVRLPVCGLTSNTPSRLRSTTTNVPSACLAISTGSEKFSPVPVLRFDKIVRAPVFGETRNTLPSTLSSTANVPDGSTIIAPGPPKPGPLPCAYACRRAVTWLTIMAATVYITPNQTARFINHFPLLLISSSTGLTTSGTAKRDHYWPPSRYNRPPHISIARLTNHS